MAENNPGEISLIGFGVLQPSELNAVKIIASKHINQLNEKTDYKSLTLKLKQQQKGKSVLHEILAHAQIGNDIIRTKVTDWSLNKCLSKALEKIIAGSIHRERTTKEIGKKIMREEKKLGRRAERI